MWGKWEKLSSTAGRAILAKPAQHADAPHAFALLRARRERPFRWGATRIFRGAWVLEFDSTADLAASLRARL
jgi:hypothetical protein